MKDLQKVHNTSPNLMIKRDKIMGKIDNRFIASGICLYSLHRNEILGYEKAAWESRIANENSKVEFKTFVPPNFESAYRESIEDAIFSNQLLGYDDFERYSSNVDFGF